MLNLRPRTGATRISLLTAALLVTLGVLMQAQAARTLQDGVYADAQATRGQALYGQRCAGCHGPALGGAQAPPLAGEGFAGKWRMEPLSALFIKIRYTMPPAAPASLTSEQAVDLVAYILKTNAFPAGKMDLAATGAETSTITWPPLRSADGVRAAASKAPPAYPPAGNLAQLMRGVFFPSSNLIFTVQTRDPAAPAPPPSPTAQGAGTSVFEW